MVDFGDIWEVFKVLATKGGLCVIHGEDNDIVMHMYDKLIREGRTGFENMAEVHNTLSEDLSFRRVHPAGREACRAPRSTSCTSRPATASRRSARRARADMPVYGETLHQYMLYTPEDYKRPNGQMYHTYPVAQVAGRPGRRCGAARWTAPSTASPPTRSAARWR